MGRLESESLNSLEDIKVHSARLHALKRYFSILESELSEGPNKANQIRESGLNLERVIRKDLVNSVLEAKKDGISSIAIAGTVLKGRIDGERYIPEPARLVGYSQEEKRKDKSLKPKQISRPLLYVKEFAKQLQMSRSLFPMLKEQTGLNYLAEIIGLKFESIVKRELKRAVKQAKKKGISPRVIAATVLKGKIEGNLRFP